MIPVILTLIGNLSQWNGEQWKGKQRLSVLTDPQRVTRSSLSSHTVLRHQSLNILTPYFPTPASIQRLLLLLKWKKVSNVRVGCYDSSECCFFFLVMERWGLNELGWLLWNYEKHLWVQLLSMIVNHKVLCCHQLYYYGSSKEYINYLRWCVAFQIEELIFERITLQVK